VQIDYTAIISDRIITTTLFKTAQVSNFDHKMRYLVKVADDGV
jgi:hypothetical protein